MLGSLIILTLSAVFLSLLVDNQLIFAREKNSLQEKLLADRQAIDDLRIRLEESQRTLTTSGSSSKSAAENLEAIRSSIPLIKAQTEILRARKAELTDEIPNTTEAFDKYREEYKEQTWRNAVGEKMDHLFLKTGRQFDRVIITNVIDTGLEISHAHGRARVDSKDLSHALQARFQWSQEVKTPATPVTIPLQSSDTSLSQNGAKSQQGSETQEEDNKAHAIAEARALVTTGRFAVANFQKLHTEALANSRYGKQQSVPGSLRTWPEQAAIMEEKLSTATAKLLLVTEKLRELSPGDPLLLPPAP